MRCADTVMMCTPYPCTRCIPTHPIRLIPPAQIQNRERTSTGLRVGMSFVPPAPHTTRVRATCTSSLSLLSLLCMYGVRAYVRMYVYTYNTTQRYPLCVYVYTHCNNNTYICQVGVYILYVVCLQVVRAKYGKGGVRPRPSSGRGSMTVSASSTCHTAIDPPTI